MKSSTQAALVGIVILGPSLARAQADLSVEKTATPELTVENRNIDYRITVTNAGPDEARNVELVDNLPDEITLIDVDGRCLTETPARLRCRIGNLSEGESRTLQIQLRAPVLTGLSPVQQIITNRVNIDTTAEGPAFGIGDQVDVVVVPQEDAADLDLRLNSTVRTDEVEFTLKVFNNSALGVDNVTTVFQVEQLPLSELSEVDPTQGNCLTPLETCIGEECLGLENEPVEVVCNLGTLIETATERAVITVSTRNIDDRDLSVTGTVSGDRADPNLNNNSVAETVDTTDTTDPTVALDQIGATCIASRLAAGQPMARDLNHLRRVRNRMKRYAWGRRFVAEYYRVSPVISRRLADRPFVCSIGRALLKPILLVSRRL